MAMSYISSSSDVWHRLAEHMRKSIMANSDIGVCIVASLPWLTHSLTTTQHTCTSSVVKGMYIAIYTRPDACSCQVEALNHACL